MSNCRCTDNYVQDSRANEFGIRRRRECQDCGRRWTTQEITIENPQSHTNPWAVYRRLAITKWLKQALTEVENGR